jgi:hypothetical protein
MADVTSIVVSVISLVAAVATALFTAWSNWWMDYSKRYRAARTLMSKYRDILIIVAYELLLRTDDILNLSTSSLCSESDEHNDAKIPYTCFLVGQYLSWTYILRVQAQFLCFSTKENDELLGLLEEIKNIFTREYANDGAMAKPFMQWHGQHMAIGEVMTVKVGKDGSENVCMSYAEFRDKWEHDEAFRHWFYSIENDMNTIAHAKDDKDHVVAVPDQRLRLLNHWLFDLIDFLHVNRARWRVFPVQPCRPAAPWCGCKGCVGKTIVGRAGARYVLQLTAHLH